MFNEHVHSRSAQREATRLRVLASAERLFREQGFGATTIRQIAADADVSTGTVMSVGDKDALLITIYDTLIGTVHHGREKQDDLAPLTPAAATQEVMDLVEPFIAYFTLDVELSREYAAVIVRGSHESQVFQALAGLLIAELETLFARTPLGATLATAAAQTVYFGYLGILMTISNGAFDSQAGIARLREVVSFAVRHEDAQP